MKFDKDLLKLAAVVVSFVWLMFFMFTLGVKFCGGSEVLGQMGDAFNMLNALFAGLAFTAVCFQLWMQQSQIDEERQARYRADRISALATRIQVTFDKILHERKLLLQVAPGFANVSFLHEGDELKTGNAINAKEEQVQSLTQLIAEIERPRITGSPTTNFSESMKELWDNQAALAMLKQMKKWIDQLAKFEREMDDLLALNERK